MATRPTTDRLRETLFNVLTPRIEGARFLDLYAGSGAVGLEALSRGAVEVIFVERAQPALKALRMNMDRLGVRARVQPVSVASFLRKASGQQFDLIFLDPPYDAAEEYEATLRAAAELLAPEGLVIAEHRRKDKLAESYGRLTRKRLLEQSDAALSFFAGAGDVGTRD
jgi:16S rRNA (guanine966-N2)-methyltransferase